MGGAGSDFMMIWIKSLDTQLMDVVWRFDTTNVSDNSSPVTFTYMADIKLQADSEGENNNDHIIALLLNNADRLYVMFA